LLPGSEGDARPDEVLVAPGTSAASGGGLGGANAVHVAVLIRSLM
jgi:hypothetical protein